MFRRLRQNAIWLACIVAAMALPSAGAAAGHRWQHYLNARFGTRADYPADIFARSSTSDNGDGVRLTSQDGAVLTIFGSWNALEQTPETLAASLQENDPQRYGAVTYREVKPKLLVLSGIRQGRVFYERRAFGDPSGAVHAMIIEYPLARRRSYDPLVVRLSRSLGWVSERR